MDHREHREGRPGVMDGDQGLPEEEGTVSSGAHSGFEVVLETVKCGCLGAGGPVGVQLERGPRSVTSGSPLS